MLSPEVNKMLNTLKDGLRLGVFTVPNVKTDRIDVGTFICFVQENPGALAPAYHQYMYEQLKPEIQAIFKGKRKGERAGAYKIIAIYDAWE